VKKLQVCSVFAKVIIKIEVDVFICDTLQTWNWRAGGVNVKLKFISVLTFSLFTWTRES